MYAPNIRVKVKSQTSSFEILFSLLVIYGCFCDIGSVRGVSEFTQKGNSLKNLKRFFKDGMLYVAPLRNMPVRQFFLQGT